MPTQMVRISDETHRVLKSIAEQTGESLQAALDRVIEEHRRRLVIQRTNEAYAALRADPKAWAEEQRDRSVWDRAAADGLDE